MCSRQLFKFFLLFFVFPLTLLAFTRIDFSPGDMVVLNPSELEESGIKDDCLLEALKSYHETAFFKMSFDEFKKSPSKYFESRLTALNCLLEELEKKDIEKKDLEEPLLKKLYFSCQCKKRYIEALPDMQDYRIVKPEALDLMPLIEPLPMLKYYWAELLDPLHRPLSILHYVRFLASDVPNYFIFLDTVESDPLLNLFIPQNLSIHYFYSEEERSKHRLEFKEGFVYNNQGELFDSLEHLGYHSGVGFAIYVLGLDCEFYVNHHLREGFHHSSEFAGQEVFGAGEISVEQGKIVMINNYSGHYHPPFEAMLETLRVLKKRLESSFETQLPSMNVLKDIKVQVMLRNRPSHFRTEFAADEFLNSEGRLLPLSSSPTPALHAAILQDLPELAEQAFLVAASLDEEANGFSALHLAAASPNPFWVQFLLAKGADSALCCNHLTALDVAVKEQNLAAVEKLFHANQSLEIKKRAFWRALEVGNLEVVQFFLKNNCALFENDKGNTLFHYAAAAPSKDVLSYLLSEFDSKAGDFKNAQGKTPLHVATLKGCLDSVKLLLSLGFELEAVDFEKNTTLHTAAEGGSAEIIEFLFDEAPKELFFLKNNKAESPMHLAAKTLKGKNLKVMIEKCGGLELKNGAGENCLFYALKSSNLDAFCELVKMGLDLKAKNNFGKTLAHVGACGHVHPLRLMLSYENLVEELDKEGNLPLHTAFFKKNKPVAHFLLKFTSKEKLFQQNNNGLSVIDLAIKLDDSNLLKEIECVVNQ